MRPEVLKPFYDALDACRLLAIFTHGRSFEDYRADALLRAGVERELNIVGEALTQAAKWDPAVADRFDTFRLIVGFRNVLVHGYVVVDNRTVRGVVENNLAPLTSQLQSILFEEPTN